MIRRIGIACFVGVVAMFLWLSPRTVRPQTSTALSQVVWYWFGHCRESKTIRVVVLLNGKQIYRLALPICHMSRADVTPAQTKRVLVFYFKGGHVFNGEYRTTPAQRVEANIWEAGGNPDDILLGVSFSTKNQELLNTIHITKPNGLSVTKLDRGLIIQTCPVSGSRVLGTPSEKEK